MSDKEKISEKLFELAEPELLQQFGENLSENQLDAFPPSVERLRQIGQNWIAENTAKLTRAICHNRPLRLLAEGDSDHQLYAASVLGLLLENFPTLGGAAVPLSVILCKRGLSTLCESCWQEQGITETEA